ncbi:MAG: PUA domain-containing protein, partial [Candidatus Hydrothermarchaeaceae archaeon]
SGTLRLKELREFPCSCPVCANSTPREILGLNENDRIDALSRHNLYASIEEIKRVKQSIYDGSLFELVERRSRSHPYLLEGLRHFLSHDIERFSPVTKRSAFFFFGPESLERPEVKRHLERLKKIEKGRCLMLLPDGKKPYSEAYDIASTKERHICIASPVFGIIPLEVEEVYPLGQHEHSGKISQEQAEFIKSCIKNYGHFERVLVHKDLDFLGIEGEVFEDISDFKTDRRSRENVELKLRAISDYQFGRGAGDALIRDVSVQWARTGRIRRIYSGDEVIATLRAHDGYLILTPPGANRLLNLPFPKNRVVATDDAVEFVRDGKSLFAGFVAGSDPEIRPYQEVIVVDKEDRFLGTGRTLLNSREMEAFERGVAVKIRHKAQSDTIK